MDKKLAVELQDVKRQASKHSRVMIRPSVDVKGATPAELEKIKAVTRRVIAEHRSVLLALKDR